LEIVGKGVKNILSPFFGTKVFWRAKVVGPQLLLNGGGKIWGGLIGKKKFGEKSFSPRK